MFRGQGRATRGQRAQQRVQRLVALQRAQVLGVGAGDVDGHVVGVGIDAGQAEQVVVGGVLDRRRGVLADVQAQDAARAAEAVRAADVVQERGQALVVEPQAVDQRVGLGQAEDARLRVARLRLGRDRAHLDEAEAHRAQPVDAAAVLVEAGGQADAVGELQPGDGHRVVHARLAPQALQPRVLQPRHRLQRQLVGLLRVEAEQERAGEGIGNERHGSGGGRGGVLSAKAGRPPLESCRRRARKFAAGLARRARAGIIGR